MRKAKSKEITDISVVFKGASAHQVHDLVSKLATDKLMYKDNYCVTANEDGVRLVFRTESKEQVEAEINKFTGANDMGVEKINFTLGS